MRRRIFAHSSYETQIRPFLSRFKRENFLFLQFEDLVSKDEEVIDRIFDFLGLDPRVAHQDIDMSAQNKSDSEKVLVKEIYCAIFSLFTAQITLEV